MLEQRFLESQLPAAPLAASFSPAAGLASPALQRASWPFAPSAFAQTLDRRFRYRPARELLAFAIQELLPGRIALVSSFGAEAAVILQLVAEIDRQLPILFIDTGKHFDETLTYRDILADRFGFTDLRVIAPDAAELAREDPTGDLWQRNPGACCALRKVRPLERALGDFDGWITGRKRLHGGERLELPLVEAVEGRFKINPLAHWSADDIDQAFKSYRLPRHPLFDEGFASIGCAPCTRPIDAGQPVRAGRWAGLDKSECGIHRPGQ